MKCAYCGKNNKDGAITCRRCGMALPLPPPKRNESEGPGDDLGSIGGGSLGKNTGKSKKRTLIAVCAAALAVLVCACIIALAGKPGNMITPVSKPYSVIDGAAVYKNGVSALPAGFEAAAAETNLDRSAAGILSGDGALCCLPDFTVPFARNVESFSVSSNGKYVVYRDANGLLWSFRCSKKTEAPVCICNGVVEKDYAVSPDGKAVIYRVEGEKMLRLYNNGKYKELGEGYCPISVSDGAKIVYAYSEADGTLCFINRKGKSSVIRGAVKDDFYLNSTHEQILFAAGFGGDAGDNGKCITLISIAGAEPKEIADSVTPLSPVLPFGSMPIADIEGARRVYTCPFKSFNNVFLAGGRLLKYNVKEGVSIMGSGTESCESAVANSRYDCVFCIDKGTLIKNSVKNGSAAETVAADCVRYVISESGDTVWYLTAGGSLMYKKGTTEKLIAENVDELAAAPSGREALFIIEGVLCSNKGGNPKKSYVYEDIKATGLFADAKGLYYRGETGVWNKLETGGKKTDLTAK